MIIYLFIQYFPGVGNVCRLAEGYLTLGDSSLCLSVCAYELTYVRLLFPFIVESKIEPKCSPSLRMEQADFLAAL